MDSPLNSTRIVRNENVRIIYISYLYKRDLFHVNLMLHMNKTNHICYLISNGQISGQIVKASCHSHLRVQLQWCLIHTINVWRIPIVML